MWLTIGSLRTYMIFYILSMIVHMWLAIRLCRKRGVTWKAGLGLGLCYIWGMCVGAKILYDLLNSRRDGPRLPRNQGGGHGFHDDPLGPGYDPFRVTTVILLTSHARCLSQVMFVTLRHCSNTSTSSKAAIGECRVDTDRRAEAEGLSGISEAPNE